jgi:hypothetical protein
MRRLARWVSGGLLLVAVGAWGVIYAGEDDSKPARSKTQFTWYGLGSPSRGKAPAKKPEVKDIRTSKDKPAANAKSAPKPLSMAEQRALEEAEYRRRIDVCDRLMEIALRNSDKAMQDQVQTLSERAWEVYTQRTANLTSVHATNLDEALLEKNLYAEAKNRDLKTRGGVPRRAPAPEFGNGRAALEEK